MFKIIKKLYMLSNKEKPYIRKSVITGLLYSVFELLQFLAVYIVLKGVTKNTEGNISFQAFVVMLVSIIGCIIMHRLSNIYQMRAGLYMAADKRIEIGDKLRYAAMGYFNDVSLGKITASLSSKLYIVENTVPLILSNVVQGILYTVVLLLGFTVFLQWKVGVVMIISAILYCVIIQLMFFSTERKAPKKQLALTKLVEGVLEYIQGIVVVRSFQDDEGLIEKDIEEVLKNSLKSDYVYEKDVIPYMTISQILLKFGTVIAMYLVVSMFLQGILPIYSSALAIIWLFVIFNQLEFAGSMLAQINNVGNAINDIEESTNVPIMKNKNVKFEGNNCDIDIKNVSFSYGTKKIIDNVSLKIPDKTSTAIIGYSGSGKTTLCNLICRFWDVDDGKISIAGHDIRDYETDQLLANFSIVFQNVFLFNDTIAENIRFGKPNASLDEIREVAKRARCDDFIMNLPHQYETKVGENGISLSGGEKQRISIARAMIKDAPIVILDEATANIDPENELKIQMAIEELTKDKTVIMIAHKLNTIRNADQIIVMVQGKIAQIGRHEELIKKEGIYKNLLKARSESLSWKL